MKTFFKNLFTNDLFFDIICLLSSIGIVVSAAALYLFGGSLQELVLNIILMICLIGLYVSYVNHQKNVMKGLLGSLLMALLIDAILACIGTKGFELVVGIVMAYLLFFINVNHFIINDTHKSSPDKIYHSQVACLIVLIVTIIICALSNSVATSTAQKAFIVLYSICYYLAIVAVVCVESKLDSFRIRREAFGWSEEEGYPEEAK